MNAITRPRLRGAAGALLGVGTFALIALAQPPSPLAPPANGPRHADSTWHAFTHATAHVSPTTTVEDATVVIRDGRVMSVDAKGASPAGARVWDCEGMHLYAGFIDAYVEVDAPKPDKSTPGVHWNTRVTPQRSALDGAGLDDKTAESLRKLGFGAAAIAPRGGVFRGSAAVVSLAKPSSESSLDRPPVYLKSAYQSVTLEPQRERRGRPQEGQPREQETPDSERWSAYPESLMGQIALIRQTFIDADWQTEARKAGANIAPNALDPLTTGTKLLFGTDDELDALRAAKVAKEFKRSAMLLGTGTEFRRLEAIKADGLPVVLPLNYPRTPDVASVGKAESVELRELMTWEQAPTNARRLDAAGLKVALTTAKLRNRGDFEENLRTAIRCGLKPERALAMLTTQPAEMLGVTERLGTIEPGKQANLVIAESDLFEAWPKKKAEETERRRDEETKPDAAPSGDEGPGAGDQPGARGVAGRGGRGGGGSGGGASKSKIREVWVDGVRHEITPPPSKDVYGTWKVVELNGTAINEPDDIAVFFVVTPEGSVTYRRSGKTERASNVKITENRLEYTIDAKKLFNIPAVLTDSGVVDEPDMMHGITPMPSGKLHTWGAKRVSRETTLPTAPREKAGDAPADAKPPAKDEGAAPSVESLQKELALAKDRLKAIGLEGENHDTIRMKKRIDDLEAKIKELSGAKAAPPPQDDTPARPSGPPREPRKDADQEEREAIASIPETYGYPFGPYMLEQIPKQPSTIEIHDATIWTSGPAGVVSPADGGTLLRVEHGRITYAGRVAGDIAPHPTPSEDVVIINGTGKHLSAGIIDCHSHTGISRGVNEGGQAVTAEVRIQDVTDPDAISWYRQLAAGVTCVNSLHGSANAIGGQNCVNKNRWGVKHPDEMHLAGAMPGIKFALGENPKQSNWGDRQVTRYPQTRMGVETLIRDRFTAAAEYKRQRDGETKRRSGAGDAAGPETFVHEGEGAADPASLRLFVSPSLPLHRDLELEALAEILEGKRLVHSHSYRQDELLMLCRVADDFGFKIGTFQHVLEGYKVADEIAKHARGGSTFSDWWAYKVEVQDAIPQNGPIMAEQGVTVSYNSDSDELARRLNTEAAKAVKYGGMKPEEALKFVTINPAKQLAIEDKVGSLEKGKDADFVIWSGPPMSEFSRPEATYVDGRCLFSLEQDKAHRATIQKERSRLIQKALAAAKRKPPESGRSRGEQGLEGPWYRPTDDETGSTTRGGMLERYYLDILNRGGDPTAARPGECGCGAEH